MRGLERRLEALERGQAERPKLEIDPNDLHGIDVTELKALASGKLAVADLSQATLEHLMRGIRRAQGRE